MKLFKHTAFIALIAFGSVVKVQAQCSAPANLQSAYSNNVTSFAWNSVSGATSYIFEAKQFYQSWAQAPILDTLTTNSYSLTGIMHSLTVDWRVKAICTNGSSAYTSATVVVPCPIPSNPSASNITMNSATVNWSPAAGYNTFISDFVVAYRPLGSTTWISLGHTSDSTMNISNLQAGTTYEWCANQSCLYDYSPPLISTFTTAACNSAGNNNTEWISRFKLGSIDRYSGAENGGYVQTNSTTNLRAGSRNNAKMMVGNSGPFTKKTVMIYIDYDDDGVYSSGELVYGPLSIKNTKTKSFKLNISSSAPSGTHGMRVIMARNGTSINGCLTGFNGETEDYSVNITGGRNKGALTVTEELAEAKRLTVYPNPANDLVNIDMPEAAAEITIFDLTGKRVYHQQAPDQNAQVSVSGWAATQYFVLITYKDGHVEKTRFTKQ